MLSQYLRDLPARARVDQLADIAPGHADIVEIDGEKVAAFRADDGRLYTVSAVCTHMKCIVRWNGLEKVWDCPCHGSQFAPTGEVLHGPAISALPAAETD